MLYVSELLNRHLKIILFGYNFENVSHVNLRSSYKILKEETLANVIDICQIFFLLVYTVCYTSSRIINLLPSSFSIVTVA